MLTILVGLGLSQGLVGTFTQEESGMGHCFQFKENGRVVYHGLGDLVRVKLAGTFSFDGDHLSVAIPNLEEKTFAPSQYQLVKWGDAKFLLAKDEVPHFLFRLRKGWRGEGSTFLRNEGLPSGQPELPAFQARHRTKPATIINCAWDDEGPLSGGTANGNLPGTVLKQVDGSAIAWIEDADRDIAYIRRLAGSKLRPGLKMEPSESPLRWRAEIWKLKREVRLRN